LLQHGRRHAPAAPATRHHPASTLDRWLERARHAFSVAPQVLTEVADLQRDATVHSLGHVLYTLRYAEHAVDEPLRGEMRATATEIEALIDEVARH
jgi:hypothetical protein